MLSNGNGTNGLGSSQDGLRQYNERLILQTIRQSGPLPKAQIARITQLSAQTVSVIINRFLDDGMLKKCTTQKGKVGQPSVPIALADSGAFSIGVKLGRKSVDLVLMNFSGRVTARESLAYSYPTSRIVLDFVVDAVNRLKDKVPAGRAIVGVGLAAPFLLQSWADELGVDKSELEAWADLDIGSELEQAIGMPVRTMNDATAACLAQLAFGEGGFQSYLYFFIGTFIGGGIVTNGTIYEGQFANAGAVGSMPVPDKNSKTVQLLTLASLSTLEVKLSENGLNLKSDIAELLKSDDVILWLSDASDALSHAIVSASSVIDFEAILIDASLPETLRARLVDMTRTALKSRNLEGLYVPEVKEGIMGYEARVLGGALLPIYENFAPHPSVLTKL